MGSSLFQIIETFKNRAIEISEVNHYGKKIKISGNYLLDFFDLNKCKEFDERALKEPFVKSKKRECINHLKSCKVIHSPHYNGAIQSYNEILIYDHLCRMALVGTPNPRAKTNEKTPDYVITLKNGFSVNLELKTVLFNDANQNFIHYQMQVAASKIGSNRQVNSIVTSPFVKFGQKIPLGRKAITESFISKTNNQVDYAQLTADGRSGILLIDTLVLGFPYFPQDGLSTYLYPACSEYNYRTKMSGFLWNVCFGKVGEPIFDYLGENHLGKNGILIDSPFLNSVIFIIRPGGSPFANIRLLGFYKSDSGQTELIDCVHQICDFVNDEKNSNPLGLPFDPLESYNSFIAGSS